MASTNDKNDVASESTVVVSGGDEPTGSKVVADNHGGARAWFANLSSPEERAAASAITDIAFIRMFRDLLCEKESSLRDGTRITTLHSLDELNVLYNKYVDVASKKEHHKKGEKKSIAKDDGKQITFAESPSSASTKSNKAETKPPCLAGTDVPALISVGSSNVAMGNKTDEGAMKPLEGKAGDQGELAPSIPAQEATSEKEDCPSPSIEKETLDVVDSASLEQSKAGEVTKEGAERIHPVNNADAADDKKGDDAKPSNVHFGHSLDVSDTADMVMKHVQVLFSATFSRDLAEVHRIMKQHMSFEVDGAVADEKSGGKGGGSKKKDAKKSPALFLENGVEALVLDPFANRDGFFDVADKVISFVRSQISCCEGYGCQSNHEESGFLSEQLLVSLNGSTQHWPHWMGMFAGREGGSSVSIPLGILLLAGFDAAIESSYKRWLTNSKEGGGKPVSPSKSKGGHVDHSEHESKRIKEIARVYEVRRSLSTCKDQVVSSISVDYVREFQKFCHGGKGEPMPITTDHLLATPLTFFTSYPATDKAENFDQNFNKLLRSIFASLKDKLDACLKDGKSGRGGAAGKSKSSPISDLVGPGKDVKGEPGSNKVQSNKEGTHSSTPSKKSKKKKKKKKQKKSHDDNVASSETNKPSETNTTNVTSPESSGASSFQDKEEGHISDKDEGQIMALENLAPARVITPSNSPTANSKKTEPPVESNTEQPKSPLPVDSTAIDTTGNDSKLEPSTPKVNVESTMSEPGSGSKAAAKGDATEDADDSVWETVEPKARGRKAKSHSSQGGNNKSTPQNRTPNSGRHDSTASTAGDGGNSHSSRKRRNKGSGGGKDRKRHQQTKIVKDVISHILDIVDVEVARRRKQGVKSLPDDKRRSHNEKRTAQSGSRHHGQHDQRRKANAAASPAASSSGTPKPMKSMRDVVVGSSAATPKNVVKVQSKGSSSTPQTKLKGSPEPSRGSKIKPGMSYKSVIEPNEPTPKPKPAVPTSVNKPPMTALFQDVAEKKEISEKDISQTSKNITPSDTTEKQVMDSIVPDSNTCSVIDEDREKATTDGEGVGDDDGNTPPLKTLLGPGNSCSASSSVASSLEAPHSSRFRHESSTTEGDVGYHLLNVCGQLSEEINTFMSRRSVALDVRRKERGAVLSALQDTLGKIWPGCCHVEMYGSCATQLDLPSSDLDLVVCGLDDITMSHHRSKRTNSTSQNSLNSTHNEDESLHEVVDVVRSEPSSPDQLAGSISEHDPGMLVDEVAEEDMVMVMENYVPDYHVNQQEYYYVPQNYFSPLSLNAQRVIRLASELELQPWAVQVKAIPTASVPVVKILADPSRIPGVSVAGGTWIMQQHIAAQAAVPPVPHDQSSPAPSSQHFTQSQGAITSQPHYFSPPSLPPWRGADIMNGLQPVDITFEGPEHGGIGSTTYSACVVQNACNETGLPPESTPVVQVAMVLKELLAQRRLNEPFSGGLSSYALLLLLLAVVKDRSIIQKEMEKMEKQRQEVSGQDRGEATPNNNTTPVAKKQQDSKKEPWKRNAHLTSSQIVSGQSASPRIQPAGTEAALPGVESGDSSEIAPDPKSKHSKGTSKLPATSSWASIAKKSNGLSGRTDSTSTTKSTNSSATTITAKTGAYSSVTLQKENKNITRIHNTNVDSRPTRQPDTNQQISDLNTALTEKESHPVDKKDQLQSKTAREGPTAISHVTPSSDDGIKLGAQSVPQGSNDVFDVLCSGELTSGKLLMHFLLFYGQHFDSQSTLIDINGTHHHEYGRVDTQNLSPFSIRPPGGNIDPVTGMFSVDPIVVYDPLEGAQDQNVAKRCYCWNNVRWVFAQCYMTVSSVVETSGTCPKSSSQGRHNSAVKSTKDSDVDGSSGVSGKHENSNSNKDVLTPILELLLSF